jgi:hypothetical protein
MPGNPTRKAQNKISLPVRYLLRGHQNEQSLASDYHETHVGGKDNKYCYQGNGERQVMIQPEQAG